MVPNQRYLFLYFSGTAFQILLLRIIVVVHVDIDVDVVGSQPIGTCTSACRTAAVEKKIMIIVKVIITIRITKKYDYNIIGTCASTCGTAAVKDTAKSRRVAATSTNETQDDAEEEDPGADSSKRGNVEAKADADQADLVFLRPTLCSTSLGLRSPSLRFF